LEIQLEESANPLSISRKPRFDNPPWKCSQVEELLPTQPEKPTSVQTRDAIRIRLFMVMSFPKWNE
jgi:hypothetical protein